MPSPRQLRTLLIGMLIGVVFVLFYTSHLRHIDEQDDRTLGEFYQKTVKGINHKKPPGQVVLDSKTGKGVGHTPEDKDADGDVDEDDEQLAREMSERLKAAEQKAKELANQKSPLKPDIPSDIVGKGNSAAGQDKKGKNKPADDSSADVTEKETETDEEHAVEVEMNKILKKSPVIIFSKTYCQFSKRAKGLLLEKYFIEPAPFVVELDIHPLGPQLQALLGEKTGRRTVPNILVNSVSIGGSDDIADLDNQKKLVEKIKDLGQKKVEMKERFIESNKKD